MWQKTRNWLNDMIKQMCRHPEHNPPNHLYIPPNTTKVYKCPKCGHATTMYGSNMRFGNNTSYIIHN